MAAQSRKDAPKPNIPIPFARVPVGWMSEWARAGVSKTGIYIMVLLCSRFDKDSSEPRAFYPADEMAEIVGVTTSAINNAIWDLKRKGFIRCVSKAHRGRCAVYEVMPIGRKATTERGNKEAGKVPRDVVPKSGKGATRGAAKIPRGVAPIRSKEGASAPPSLARRVVPARKVDKATIREQAARNLRRAGIRK